MRKGVLCPLVGVIGALAIMVMSSEPAQAAREAVTKDELLADGWSGNGLTDNRWFMPSDDAVEARHDFLGTIVLEEVEMGTEPAQLSTTEVLGKNPKIFPAVEIAFFTHGSDLVPVSRDVIRYGSTDKGRSYWDVIVQPGRVWSEPGDGGWSRASFPFALVHSIEGETHNGIATFPYNDKQVSNLRCQIV